MEEARRDATHMAKRLATDVAHERELRRVAEDLAHSESDKLTVSFLVILSCGHERGMKERREWKSRVE